VKRQRAKVKKQKINLRRVGVVFAAVLFVVDLESLLTRAGALGKRIIV
jgi:hypothetical protein